MARSNKSTWIDAFLAAAQTTEALGPAIRMVERRRQPELRKQPKHSSTFAVQL